ncbi:MAG: DUF134 domain-containing protein, partial [bacterium]|nr:DUF134 domain-containing protein [bacterium]
MPRPHRLRRVAVQPPVRGFKPMRRPLRELETVTLDLDELEALRWADLEGLYQEEAAARMDISRATFARLVSRGRAKVADTLINGKALLIGEGPVASPGTAADANTCPVHGGPRRRGRRCRCRREEGPEACNHGDKSDDEQSAEARKGQLMKIAITSQGPELSSPLDPRFGRARYVLVVDRSSGEVEVVDNAANAQTPQGAGLAAV